MDSDRTTLTIRTCCESFLTLQSLNWGRPVATIGALLAGNRARRTDLANLHRDTGNGRAEVGQKLSQQAVISAARLPER